MYKVLIETSLSDLLIVLMKDQQLVDFIREPNLVKKSEKLPFLFENLLSKNLIKTSDIRQFFVTLGPGSFMGSRVGLIFVRTICQITKCHLFTTNSLHFISQNKNGIYYIDAKSEQSYQGVVKNKQINISLEQFHPPTPINYDYIINNLNQYLELFTYQTNILQIKPIYLKKPKVG